MSKRDPCQPNGLDVDIKLVGSKVKGIPQNTAVLNYLYFEVVFSVTSWVQVCLPCLYVPSNLWMLGLPQGIL